MKQIMQVPMIGKIKKPYPWIVGLVVSSLLGIATTVTLTLQDSTPKLDIAQQTVTVASKDLVIQVKASGVVQAVQKINLSPKGEGRIVQLYVQEGDRVQQSELVARMDFVRLQAQINQYKGVLAKVEAELAKSWLEVVQKRLPKRVLEWRQQKLILLKPKPNLTILARS
ncbi:MAG: biotin/lipoyl-binding protein [Cyanomargarita calcarea GSE-NOS-MK-12-04C]|jgi:HlyD family secretion protein|uniref:Biotin/lipoyl-binding protein n=1 Tax=Cyanomargarita calcarea GSE-NOS-MK-12-04C TaxID=2839659 RepID=A0A951QHV6_9CYAN|nr:biotin/lipoyl-binding protein [Cyanomargarita calcarea GSE-NOS-MK-12-04C]